MPNPYTYSIADDTANGALAQDKLHDEIAASSITVALKGVNVSGDDISVDFASNISAGEETTLNGILSAHDGILGPNDPQSVSLANVTIDKNRLLMADNRVPAGYTLYVTGEADDISTGAYGGGTSMKFDSTTSSREFQMLNHMYAIGARVIYEGCSLDNYFDATMIAPASSGFTNSTGDFDKVEIIPASGLHLFKPVSAGTGAWSGTLSDKLTSTNILKATPVPAAGNTGWFDYDSTTNVLTANMDQEGGYNLYDFNVNLHAFGRKVWASSADGAVAQLDVTGLVGKLIFNSWKVKFEFKKDGGSLSSEKARLFFIVATKQNI